jgi:hypothetical protein
MRVKFLFSAKLIEKSTGYGDRITNRPEVKSIEFKPVFADHDEFHALGISIGSIDLCMSKNEARELIKALEGVLK